MLTLDDIRQHVMQNGFGRELREFSNCYLSRGIIYAYESDRELWKPYIEKALKQSNTDNFGGYYELGEEPTIGKEYYLCPSPYGKDIRTGIIIHKENNEMVMYFHFER